MTAVYTFRIRSKGEARWWRVLKEQKDERTGFGASRDNYAAISGRGASEVTI